MLRLLLKCYRTLEVMGSVQTLSIVVCLDVHENGLCELIAGGGYQQRYGAHPVCFASTTSPLQHQNHRCELVSPRSGSQGRTAIQGNDL